MRKGWTLAILIAGMIGARSPARPPAEPALETDRVLIEAVSPRPMAGSGIFHFLVELKAAMGDEHGRLYYITYFGEGQVLPDVGATCDLTYSRRRINGLLEGPPWSIDLPDARYVEDFTCDNPPSRMTMPPRP